MGKILISIIIPVYKEKEVINNTVANILSFSPKEMVEIIIIDSEKNTPTFKNLKIKNSFINGYYSGKGRAIQMNYGAKKAKGKYLLFLHCDTILPNNYFEIINETLSSNIAGYFSFSTGNNSYKFKIMALLVNFRNKLTKRPYGDQALFIERNFFFEIGLFLEIPIMEDIEIAKRLNKIGKVKIVSEKIKTSARKWEKNGFLKNSIKNIILSNLYYLGVSPEKLEKYY